MMLFGPTRRAPSLTDGVLSSDEVLTQGLPITRIIRWRHVYMYLSARESDDSEPIACHFAHLVASDSNMVEVRLARFEYALRGFHNGSLGSWTVFDGKSARRMDALLRSGVVDQQHDELTRRLL